MKPSCSFTGVVTKSPEAGFTLIEIMVVVTLVGVLSLIGAISVLRARTTGNEGVALSNLRQLAMALVMYSSVQNVYPDDGKWKMSMYGGRCGPGYAPEPDFGPPQFCLNLVGATDDVVSGYRFTYAGPPTVAIGCTLTANPSSPGATGTRAFFVDQTNALRHCTGAGPADATDPTIDQPPVPCP